MPDSYFVPDGTFDDRKSTATALVGAADEHGISQRAIRSVQGGFYVSEELAGKVFSDEDLTDADQAEAQEQAEAEEKAKAEATKNKESGKGSKKASGNRAAKNTSTDKE